MTRPRATWEPAAPSARSVSALEACGFERRLALLLAARGLEDEAAARAFLTPSLDQLRDPSGLGGIDGAVERIVAAIGRAERVAIVGDYDADGVTATALLAATMRSVGLAVETLLPRRDQEGYGFQPVHAQRASAAGCSLIVTVDCGISSFEGAEEAARLGIDLVVTDHHLPEGDLPRAVAVVNPKLEGADSPFAALAGSGLAFELARALLRKLEVEVPLAALLRIACIGTIADVAPLVGENRVIAAAGLEALARPRSAGLRALVERSGVRAPVRAADVGFRLGPRLNAAGRLGAADDALELLLERDPQRARELVETLERANAERQAIESRILDEARRQIRERGATAAVVAAWSPDWHRGVVGIAAGRLARELHRPVLLLAQEEGVAVGSGRSVEGISLHEFLLPWADRFEKFGGHDLAVGLTVVAERLDELRREWEEAASAWPAERLIPRLRYELELAPDELDDELWNVLGRLEPFGSGNPEPLIRMGPLVSLGTPRAFGSGHVSVWVRAARGDLELVAWGWAERGFDWTRPFEVLGHLDRDRRSGRPTVRVVEARAADRARRTRIDR